MADYPLTAYGGGDRDGMPADLGVGDGNGQPAVAEPVRTLELACVHLAARRKLPIPGVIGYVTLTAATKYSFSVSREAYTRDAVLRATLSSTDDRGFCSIRVEVSDVSYDDTTDNLNTGTTPRQIELPFTLGANEAADIDGQIDVDVTITPYNTHSGATADTVVWSIAIDPQPVDVITVTI